MNKAIERLREVKKLAGTIGGISFDGGSATQLLDDWNKLEDQNAELRRERDKLAAYQKELVRELQSCQNVLHMMAHHGEVTWAYSEDAKKVLDKAPDASLAELEAHVERLNKQCNALYDEAINAGCCSEYMKVNYASGEPVQAIMGGKK